MAATLPMSVLRGKADFAAAPVGLLMTLSGHYGQFAEEWNQLVPQFRARYQRQTAASTRDQRSVRPTATWHQCRLRHQHQACRIDSEQWGQWIAMCQSLPPLSAVYQRENDPSLPQSGCRPMSPFDPKRTFRRLWSIADYVSMSKDGVATDPAAIFFGTKTGWRTFPDDRAIDPT